ncbi:MAG: zinc-binding dehydrogenase [Acidimicrobiales bacterium]
MRTGLITGARRFELVDAPEPTPGPGVAVVEIDLCGICGSDVHAYQSGGPYSPTLCGHEWTGVVAAVGAEVSNVGEGDRVVGGAAPACGRCSFCQRGKTSWCSAALAGLMGRDGVSPHSGGFAPRQAVDARRLTRAPASLSAAEAALVEPTTVAVHAVRRSRIRLGDVAVVIGAGPIGLLTAQAVRAAGAGLVVVAEPDDARRALALELGADAAYAPGAELDEAVRVATMGVGPDHVFECAGVAATVQAAARLARRGGALCLVGVAVDKATIDPAMWVVKELSVDASLAYGHEDTAIAAGLIADGRISAAPLHSATIGLDELPETFEELASGPSAKIKVLVDPRA